MKCARLPAGAQPPAASTQSRPPSSRPTPPRDRSRPDPRGGRARLSLLLPVLALLLGAVDLLTAAPADARTTREPVVTPIWSATLTVDVGNNQYGCSGHPSHTACSTNLTDNDFTYNGVGYEVQDLFLHSGHILVFRLNGETGYSMQEKIGPLTLNVGGSTFAIRDAVTGTSLTWNNTGLRWTDGQTVPVSLTRVVPAGVPVKPGAFFRLRAGDGQVAMHYTCRVDYSGKCQYRQKAGTNAWGAWTDIPESRSGGVNRASWTVRGLNNGTAYRFQLRGVNRVGAGLVAEAGPVTPAAAPLPSHIIRIRARPLGSNNVELTWDLGHPYDSSITKFQYRYRQKGRSFASWTNIRASHALTGSHVVTGLENWKEYTFQVRAVNAAGNGPASAEARAIPGSKVVHGKRFSGIVVEPGRDRVDLRWTVSRDGGDPGHTEYVVWWREAGATAWRKYSFWSWSRSPGTTLSPRVVWGGNSMAGVGNWPVENPEPLKPGTSYDVRLHVGSGYTTKAPGLVYETTVSTTGASMAPPPAAPALEWARVNGAELALRFDKGLDESSVPAASAFSVSVAGAARGVSSVAVRQDLVTLTLASAVSAGEAVTLGYTPPSSGGLRLSGGGAAVAAFSGQTVANDTPSGQPQVQAPPKPAAPLTARFTAAPSEHRGKGALALRVAFSAPVAGRAKDAAIQVSGGTLARAVRVKKRKDLWALTVNPSGYETVTVTLPATADCAAAGAVCTADGRRLETALTHTIQGPPALSVADASAREGPGATLDFAVTLSRAASAPVTVRYATRDGTAKKGKDYSKAKGTLSFAAGETAKTVSVALLDDAHDEGSETFRLVLKKAEGAAIADGEATGTIENSDPLQKDWLARFGRAAAADAVAAVTSRLETPRGAGSHLTLGGHRVNLSGTDGGAALEQALTGFAGLLGAPGGAAAPKRWLSDIGPADRSDVQARTIDGRQLLLGSSFRAVMGGGAGAQWTSWGQGASVSQFASATPSLSLSGETATGSLGMDYERGRLLTGFAMTHSLGEGTAQGAGRSYLMGSSVTTMLPYVRYALSERLSAWGLAGTGSGRLTLDLDGGPAERYGADLAMTLAAVGVRGDLVTPAQAGGFALALKADAFWVRTESDSVSAPGAGNLAGARADASRVRAVLDGSRSFALAGGAALTPSLSLGLRQDGGDAETGTGFELGAGVGYADPSRGLDMALKVHGLAAHAEGGYEEWGVSGSLRLVPGGGGRGLSASLTPSYGADPGGSERLWAMPDAHALAANDDAPLSHRLDAEVGYGMALFGGGFTGTPHVGMGLSDTARELRLGWRLAPADGGDFEFHLDASRRDSAGDVPEHRVGFGLTARW